MLFYLNHSSRGPDRANDFYHGETVIRSISYALRNCNWMKLLNGTKVRAQCTEPLISLILTNRLSRLCSTFNCCAPISPKIIHPFRVFLFQKTWREIPGCFVASRASKYLFLHILRCAVFPKLYSMILYMTQHSTWHG